MAINLNILKNRLKNVSLTIQEKIVEEALSFLPDTSFVSNKIAEERLEICEACELLDISSRKCMLCGCFVDLKTKVKKLPYMEPEKCDNKNW